MFRILVELATLLYIVLALFDRSYLPKKSLILGSVVAFTAILGLATLNAEDPSRSFWSNFERMEGYVTVLHLLFFFIVTTSVFRTKKMWYALFNTSLAVSIVTGLRAFADYDTSRDGSFIVEFFGGIKMFFLVLFGKAGETIRVAGTLGNSSYLGVYSLIHIFLGGLLFTIHNSFKKFKESWIVSSLYILAVVFNVLVLYNTGTRGSFVGLVAGVFVASLIPLCIILFGKSSVLESTKSTIKKVSAVSLVVIILAVSLLGIYKDSAFVKKSDLLNRFSSLVTFDLKGVLDTQGKARTMLWSMAFKGVEERPILGWGEDNFPYVFAKYYDPKMYDQEQWFDRTHNVFFDWLIAGGVLGLLSYLVLFVALLITLWKKVKLNEHNHTYDILQKSIITGLLVAYFVHNLFIFDNLVSYILFFILLAYVNQNGLTHESVISPIVNKLKKAYDHLVKREGMLDTLTARILIILIAVLAFGYVSNAAVYKPYMAGTTLIEALKLSQPEAAKYLGEQAASPAVILKNFQQALSYDTFGNTEIRERLAETIPDVVTRSKDQEVSKALTGLVASEFEKAVKETPNDPRPYVFLSLYLQKFGLFEQSMTFIDKAIKLSPTKQSFIYQKGIIQLTMQKFDDAIATFKMAYELEPSSSESKTLYALALIYSNKVADANKLVGDDLKVQTDQRFLDALMQTKQYSEIIAIANKKITADPTNPQAHMSLAGLYLKMYRSADAIAEIRKVITLAPDFKTTGEFYIKEIQAGRDPSQAPSTQVAQ